MKAELFNFQKIAVDELRAKTYGAMSVYQLTSTPQVISFTAPTGSGKTIMMATFIENVLFGDEKFPEQPDAIFVWLSDSPDLNLQSKAKIDNKADKIRFDQCVMIESESFDKEVLDDGHIYFLNTQKIGKKGNLTMHSDGRQYTIWETLANTAEQKADHLYFIIDEAHRGMQGKEAGKATSIMQKFIKGSEDDKLKPMPLVIGMSATPERFDKLVKGTTSTISYTVVKAADVRSSGLLKDRIHIIYPSDVDSNNDMAILQAAADEWKDKCIHWYNYSYNQHYAQVNPVFVIQVENTAGDESITATDLDGCIETIEKRTGWKFSEGEVVHTFGSESSVYAHGLNIVHVDPADIADNKNIRIVFFKENLTTGWDCPRAETMMSFRHAQDATYIAQLLGRMVRTPLQRRVQIDETLNDVRLFLPYFDRDNVENIVNELQSSEGGEIPTYVEGEELGSGSYSTWTSRNYTPKDREEAEGQITFESNPADYTDNYLLLTNPNNPVVNAPEESSNTQTSGPVDKDHVIPEPNNAATPKMPVTKGEQTTIAAYSIDRDAIVKHINNLSLTTYSVRSIKINSYLKSLLALARLLSQSDVAPDVLNMVRGDIVSMMRNYIKQIKAEGKYNDLAKKVLQVKLDTKIFDVFGGSLDDHSIHNLYLSSDSDLDRQLRIADSKLASDGIVNKYLNEYYDFADDLTELKVDVVLFVANEECMAQLHKYAEDKFHKLNDKYRMYVNGKDDKFRLAYHRIIADGDCVSKHAFCIPAEIVAKNDVNGKPYSDHLFIDEKTGTAKIELNNWEKAVLEEEQNRSDFVCWMRNPSRNTWALCVPYEIDNVDKAMYPDFLIIRADPYLGYIVDILEPHGTQFADNLGKAKGLAKYAMENAQIGRVQLIREQKDIAGNKVFKRLDLATGVVQNKVLAAINNDELDHIFDIYSKTINEE